MPKYDSSGFFRKSISNQLFKNDNILTILSPNSSLGDRGKERRKLKIRLWEVKPETAYLNFKSKKINLRNYQSYIVSPWLFCISPQHLSYMSPNRTETKLLLCIVWFGLHNLGRNGDIFSHQGIF